MCGSVALQIAFLRNELESFLSFALFNVWEVLVQQVMLVKGENENDHRVDEYEERIHHITHSFEKLLKFVSFVVIVQSYKVHWYSYDEIKVELIEQLWAFIGQLIHYICSKHRDSNDSSIMILIKVNSKLVQKEANELVPENEYLQDEVRSNVQHQYLWTNSEEIEKIVQRFSFDEGKIIFRQVLTVKNIHIRKDYTNLQEQGQVDRHHEFDQAREINDFDGSYGAPELLHGYRH
jgi:hypothetical protein